MPLISVPGGRFPRASPVDASIFTPRRYAPAGSSVDAIPAGVATLHSNQLIPIYIEKLFSMFPSQTGGLIVN